MNETVKKISVIIPVYKVEKELDRCVSSVQQQTYSNIEIVLVDDGSPDRCPQMCDEYAVSDKRIRVIHKKNGGLSDARNTGLSQATGEYILYVDSDDYLESDACERLVELMKDGIDFVAGACKKIKGDDIVIERRDKVKSGRVYDAKDFYIQSIKGNDLYPYACINLYRKKFLTDNNLYFKMGYLFEDTQLLPDIMMKAKKVVYLDYPYYNYILRNDSITGNNDEQYKREMIVRVYSEWMNKISEMQDEKLRRYMKGALVFQYLWNCRAFHITDWEINGMGFGFSFRYALGIKEKIKVILFSLFPKWFSQIPV